ncbi:MAG: BlaI/MecI/CopY family transcriptional regulator [Gemmatimonadaceae bacterium]
MDDVSLGERELDVMTIVWERGSGTVGEVRERLPVTLAYTTVLTILRNLEAKGFLSHQEEGKAHRYFPTVEQRAAQQTALARLVNSLFHGSAEQLLAQLVADHDLNAADLRRLARRLSERPPRKRGVK